MKPAPFEFFSPGSLEETLGLLARYGDECRILAGGQSLVPLMNLRMVQPRVLISINRCRDLAYLEADDTHLRCGALTRQREAEHSALVRETCPLLAAALPYVGGLANRNRGTVCGSLAHADPVAELPAVAVALGATFVVNGVNGIREVAAEDFFISELTTCIGPGEMLQEVRFPRCAAGGRAAFVESGNRRHGFALVGMAGSFAWQDNGSCAKARIAAIGLGPTAIRLRSAEAALVGRRPDASARGAALAVAAEGASLTDDFHADAAYRKQLASVLLERLIEASLTPASN